ILTDDNLLVVAIRVLDDVHRFTDGVLGAAAAERTASEVSERRPRRQRTAQSDYCIVQIIPIVRLEERIGIQGEPYRRRRTLAERQLIAKLHQHTPSRIPVRNDMIVGN